MRVQGSGFRAQSSGSRGLGVEIHRRVVLVELGRPLWKGLDVQSQIERSEERLYQRNLNTQFDHTGTSYCDELI